MLFFKPHKYLGIDIGTSSIKLVELKKEGNEIVLNTYGALKLSEGQKDAEKENTDILRLSDKQLSDLLRQLLFASRATAKDAVFSVPVFASFVTLIDLPQMSEREIAASLPYEARKYIPVPISEVQFNWSVLKPYELTGGQPGPMADKMQVLIAAVPKDVIAKYKNIAQGAGLKAEFEIETFSMTRALARIDMGQGAVIVADIGAKSTEICVIDEGLLRLSHNFETSGSNITQALSGALNLDLEKAEEMKMQKGIKSALAEKSAQDAILPLLDMIVFEIDRTNLNYQQRTGRRAQKIILSGGTANLPGFVDYLSNHLGIAVTIANPFSKISTPPVLDHVLREIGPSLIVAVGLAKRNLV